MWLRNGEIITPPPIPTKEPTIPATIEIRKLIRSSKSIDKQQVFLIL